MKDEVRSLWKRCFNDSDEFMDLYFTRRYRDEINMSFCRDGKVISALQMIPYPMTFCGGVIPTSYISGACTHPDYREQGAMRRLLKETHRRMYEDGVLLATLIPAEEWLVGYYGKSGYVPAFGYTVDRIEKNYLDRCVSPYRIETCEEPDARHYQYFDARMRERNSCILHTEEDFGIILADLKLSGGKLLAAYGEDGGPVGMAFTVMEREVLCIKELLADNDAVRNALLDESAHIYKVYTMECTMPSSAGTLYLGMARAVCVEGLLQRWAARYPDKELCICVEEDEAIPENSGYYTVSGGVCRRTQWPGCDCQMHTVPTLTRLLLEAEHPYMSLS